MPMIGSSKSNGALNNVRCGSAMALWTPEIGPSFNWNEVHKTHGRVRTLCGSKLNLKLFIALFDAMCY